MIEETQREQGGGGLLVEAREATITTAQVEIKTLTIRGKQVTLALFRQFPKADWLDNRMMQCGLLWGRVHYQPDKDDSEFQIVWQRGDELCRCAQPSPGVPERWQKCDRYGNCTDNREFWWDYLDSHAIKNADSELARRYREACEIAADAPQLFIAV